MSLSAATVTAANTKARTVLPIAWDRKSEAVWTVADVAGLAGS
jgi:hypothetical protein